MADSHRNVLVGVFVLVGLCSLGGIIVLFGQAPQWLIKGDTYPLTIYFESAEGIRAGTSVTVLGKRVGHVTEVDFADADHLGAGVNVVVAIKQQYKIPADSQVQTIEAGLLGGGRPPIEIIPGVSQEILQPGSVLSGIQKSSMSAIFPEGSIDEIDRTIKLFGDFADAATPAVKSLEAMFKEQDPAKVDPAAGKYGNLYTASARLDELLIHFNDVFGDPDQKRSIKQAIENFHTISEDGKVLTSNLREASTNVSDVVKKADGVIVKADQSLDTLNQRLETIAQATVTDLEKAGKLIDYLSQSASNAAEGEGTVGKLLTDEELYESLVLTVKRLNMAIEEIQLLAEDWKAHGMKVRGGI